MLRLPALAMPVYLLLWPARREPQVVARCETHCPPGGGVPVVLIGGAVVAAAVAYGVVVLITSAVFLTAAVVVLSAAIIAGVAFVVREVRQSRVPVRAQLPRTRAVVRAELEAARAQLAAVERRALPAPKTALRGYVLERRDEVPR